LRAALRVSRLFALRIGGAALQFVTLVSIARLSSVQEFGAYAAALGLGALLSGTFGMGLITRALRIKSEGDRFASGFVIGNSTATVAVVLALIGLSTWIHPPLAFWAVAAATASGNELMSGFAQSLLFGRDRGTRAEVVVISRRILPFLAVLCSVLFSTDVFVALSVGNSLAILFALAMTLPTPPGHWTWRELVLGGKHYWSASVWSMAQQADVTLVGAISGASQAASYGAGFRLASPVHLITTSITSLIVPRMSGEGTWAARKDKGRNLRRLGYGYGIAVIAASPLAAWLGPWVLGDDYLPYSWVFTAMVLTAGISVLNQIQISMMYAAGRQRAVAWDTAGGSVLGLSLVTLGAVLGGALMAAVGYALSRAVLFLILRSQLRKVDRSGRDQEDAI
jgi:O-antigen/teichoic acid export membrane protein